jgi:hypothetical protein
MTSAQADGGSPPGRFWLYAPYVVLSALVLAWSAGWLVVRSRAEGALDGWLAREAALGRTWTCADRRIGGYPFRVTLDCASLSLNRGDLALSLGRTRALAQVYQPRHVIAEIEGPLRLAEGRVVVEGEWGLLRASARASAAGLDRASLEAEKPRLRVAGLPTAEPLALAGQRLSVHARPSARRGEGAYDVALRAAGAVVPGLDSLLGGAEPADLGADAVVTRIAGLGPGPLPALAERWRMAGGRVEAATLSAVKGPRRLEARGDLGLDDQHRPTGRLDVAAAGVEGTLKPLAGGGAADAVTGMLGGRREGERARPAPGALRPLAAVRLENGRVLVGPVTVPGLRLSPLY